MSKPDRFLNWRITAATAAVAGVSVFLLLAGAAPPTQVQPTARIDLATSRTITASDSAVVTFTLTADRTSRRALEFNARMQASTFAGSNLVLRVELNGSPLTEDRLVNKPLRFSTANDKLLTWADGDRWRLVYSPGFDAKWNAPGDPHQVLGVSPFQFQLRVGDLLRVGPNRLVLRHLGRNLPAIEIAALCLLPIDATAAPPKPETANQKQTVVTMTALPFGRGGSVELDAGGGRTAHIATDISIPGGGWRHLGDTPSGWSGLHVDRDRLEAQSETVTLRREQELHGGLLRVRDVLVNRTSSDLGLIVRYTLRVQDQTGDVCLGGVALPAAPVEMTNRNMQHPTASLVTGGAALGLLPANDVLWVHAATFRAGTGIGLLDDQLCIAARDSVVLMWQALACPGRHEEWINAVREQLGANFTLDGNFAFGSFAMSDWPQDRLRDWIRMRSLRFLSSPAPTQSGGHGLQGAALLDAPEAQEKMRRFASAVHAASPDVRVLAYFHAYLTNRADAATTYRDTRHLGPDGRQIFYPYKARPQEFGLFVPIQGSAFTRDLEKLIARIRDLGFDGLYWDEMSTSVTPYAYDAPWDGASGDIDPKSQRLLRRKSAVPLLAQPWITAQVARLAADGRAIVANTEPVTPSMMQYRFPRFVETPESQNFLLAQLWSPIGLGDRQREKTPEDIAARIYDHIEHGVLYYYYLPSVSLSRPTLASYMFPATPVRIRPGVFEARERILTTRSGRYGFGDASGHEVHVFAANADTIAASVRTSLVDGVRWTELLLAPGQSVAIVRTQSR